MDVNKDRKQGEILVRNSKENSTVSHDFRSNRPMPESMREAINAHLAIEEEDAKSAGTLGFMARALVIATMPYKDPKADSFTRVNGGFKLRILAGYEGGIPFGIYPRLLMSWVATEAVKKQSPVIELGDSMRVFLRDVLQVRGASGGARGSATRITEQMKRLFGSLITAEMEATKKNKGFRLRNVLIADGLDLNEEDAEIFDNETTTNKDGDVLWTPQSKEVAGTWQSRVHLSHGFFKECIENPVPIDLRAYGALRDSPLAMDVYTWVTYRMSYTFKKTRPIPWLSLMGQFGSNYNGPDIGQNVRNFKKAFLQALTLVKTVYPQANIEVSESGLILSPSRTHIPKISKQQTTSGTLTSAEQLPPAIQNSSQSKLF
jgi:hypothetical protein